MVAWLIRKKQTKKLNIKLLESFGWLLLTQNPLSLLAEKRKTIEVIALLPATKRDILLRLWTESQVGNMAIKSIDYLFGELKEMQKMQKYVEET